MTDYRSDTITQPTTAMLHAMFNAPVGDDVFEEDPSVNLLQERMALLFGMEDALFCPSGTMANQIAIKCHTQPGEEVICESMSHVYIYEAGGIAFHSGCQVKAVTGDRGRISATQVQNLINPNDIHKAPSRLVCLENTANRGGGSCYELTDIQEIKEVCLQNNLKLHLDGARLFNALVARQQEPAWYGKTFNSISVCLSKGLGAPVGSVLIGDFDFIRRARKYRKLFGGGMRQAGYLAAAGIFALDNHVERLQQDHQRAHEIAEALLQKSFTGHMLPVETNIIIFEVTGSDYTAASLAQALKEHGILVIPISATQVRIVLHLGITAEMVQHTIQVLNSL